MDDKYKINDTRGYKSFSQKTFSGYKKSEVINSVLKAIEAKKLENACHWATECICSGYTVSLWDKLLLYASKVIHINNPQLPSYLLRKNEVFYNQVRRIQPSKKDNLLLLRNSQMIRNLIFDVITTLTMSLKTKRYDKLIKINEKEDFLFPTIQKKLLSQMKVLPDGIIQFHDPDELRTICNEIFTMLKNKQFGYEKACYWVLWLKTWEALHKKKKKPWNLSVRKISGINPKYGADLLWVIWCLILEEARQQNNKRISEQISSIYSLYKFNYSSGKQTSRLPYVFHAIGYLTHTINFKTPIRPEYHTYIQVQCNVNKMFMLKKSNEISTPEIVFDTGKKKKKEAIIDFDPIKDKIDIFNELDTSSSLQ
jgi:hypothetical protein